MSRPLLGCILTLTVVLAGCSKDYERLAQGEWRVDTARSPVSTEGLKESQIASLRRAYESFSLRLLPDHTFRMRMFLPVEGKWTLTGDRLELAPNAGQPLVKIGGAERPVFRIDGDGQTLTLQGSATAFVLTKRR